MKSTLIIVIVIEHLSLYKVFVVLHYSQVFTDKWNGFHDLQALETSRAKWKIS